MQEHAERSAAVLCLFLCPTNVEGLQRRCLQISSRHPQAHAPVRSGYWQPTHQIIDSQWASTVRLVATYETSSP